MESCLQDVLVQRYDGSRDGVGTGCLHGRGRLELLSGDVFHGTWQQGRLTGTAEISLKNGFEYSGTVTDSCLTGSGVYEADGSRYEGELVEGQRHGTGRLSFASSPLVYEGQWRHGKRHGRGTLYYDAARTTYYQGQWQEDQRHGEGTAVYASGNHYSGQWCHDRKQGRGTMAWLDRGEQYSGHWAEDLPDGLGEHVWWGKAADGSYSRSVPCNRYRGMFMAGRRCGEGALFYASGARYEGTWLNDLKHSSGIFVFEDGSVFTGGFQQDKPCLAEGQCFGPDTQECPAGDEGHAGAKARPGVVVLHVADLQQESVQPPGACKALAHLLLQYNSELRTLYRSCCHLETPYLPADALPSPTLLLAQLWELAHAARLLSSNLTLAELSAQAHRSRQPCPAVQERREQVLQTSQAGAVVDDDSRAVAPCRELSYRDFCELLVRLAYTMFPAVPGLHGQLQQLISQHLEPLFAAPPGRGYHEARLQPGVAQSVREQIPALLEAYQEAVASSQQGQQQDQRAAASPLPPGSRGGAGGGVTEPWEALGPTDGSGFSMQHPAWQEVVTARQVVTWLQGCGILRSSQEAAQAVASFCTTYLHAHSDSSAGLVQDSIWMADTQLLFPEFAEHLAVLACESGKPLREMLQQRTTCAMADD